MSFPTTTPLLGDSDNNLLFKIAQALTASASPITASYVLKTGDTMTGDLAINPTWSDGATHTGLKVNVTDVSSASASNYVDFQVAGVSQFSIRKADGFTHARLLRTDVFAWFVGTDASGNTSPVVAEAYHEVSGSVGGGGVSGGVAFDFRCDSDTADRQLQARVSSLWDVATNATRTSHIRISPVLNAVTTEAVRIANAGLDLQNGTPLRIAGVAYFNPLSVYAAGAVYTLTATPAAVDFGTTDPIITVNAAGTYSLRARVRVALNAATFAANQTLTVKLRRTNNTATDVANAIATWIVPIISAQSNTLAIIILPEVFYTTALTNDTIQLFADISVVPSAGTISIDAASIVAVRLS